VKKPGMTHPPKKKRTNKPRPEPPERLPREQQLSKAAAEFKKAMRFLRQAELAADRGGLPDGCVHLAYYAMHHCAVAPLLCNGGVDKYGDVPQSHEHVTEHFSKAIADLPGLVSLGVALEQVRAHGCALTTISSSWRPNSRRRPRQKRPACSLRLVHRIGR